MTEHTNVSHTINSKQEVRWERDVIEKITLAAVTEQRRTRRWNIFFKALMFILFAVAMTPYFEQRLDGSDKHTAVIDITGIILEGSETNAKSIIRALHDAVQNEGTQGIILHMNTPGGSPVQSAYIYEEILQIKQDNPALPIYAVVSDICASGGYYIAAAADKIFVNQASIVGSIGVIMDGYGFTDTLKKLGVERRLLVAGENKAFLDPFAPVKTQEIKHAQAMLNQIHQQFIEAVRQGRGDRLQDNGNLFTGLVWTGDESIKLGLADAIGNDGYVAKEIIGTEKQVDFTPRGSLLERISSRVEASFSRVMSNLIKGDFVLR